jgi:hypothetical protein
VPYTSNAVVAHSFSFPEDTFTMNVSGAVTRADVGKAVSIDPAADNTVRLALNNDPIYGRLESFETGGLDRLTVGAVSTRFQAPLPTDGTAIGRGATVVGGATPGCVKAAATPDIADNTVLVAATAGAGKSVVVNRR